MTLTAPAGTIVSAEHRGYTGEEALDQLGLLNLNRRLYDPRLGRFLQADPIASGFFADPQQLNRYAYAGNSPLSASDPTGFSWASDAGDAIGNALGLDDVGTDAANAISNATRSVFGPVDPGRWGQQGAAAGAASGAIVGGVAGGVAGAAAGSLAAPGVGTVAVGVGGAAEGAAAGAGLGAAAGGALGYGAGVAVHAAEGDDNAAPPAKDDVSTLPPGIGPGPNAPPDGGVPAGPTPRPTAEQQKQINDQGNTYGCHNCGTTEPGTSTGNWIGDHQPPTAALNPDNGPQSYMPSCRACSNSQGGGRITALLGRRGDKKQCSERIG